jgi:hypothetical protein
VPESGECRSADVGVDDVSDQQQDDVVDEHVDAT